MRLVKFENGKYGIRRYWFFAWFFQDLMELSFSWTRISSFFYSCQGTKDEALKVMHRLRPHRIKYTIVKEER